MPSRRASYTYSHIGEDIIYLVDHNHPGFPSITNDVEGVLQELETHGELQDRRVIYRDSEGIIDEIIHLKGQFMGFRPLGRPGPIRDLDDAVSKVRRENAATRVTVEPPVVYACAGDVGGIEA